MEKWKDRPFVLLGVNSDGTNQPDGLKKYKKQAEEMGVTWRSFQNESTDPQISDVWKVQGWPTLYYIDHNGIIKHKNVRGAEEMEKALEEMIAAAEKAQK
ncbi:MAG: hypothetical protein KDC98_10325 [Planctomycetes bacterium]|nr:hypothetical protein [Planctomycetota bacterium]